MDFSISLNPNFLSDGQFLSSTQVQCGTLRPKFRLSKNPKKGSKFSVLEGRQIPLGPKHVSHFSFRALPKLHVAISGEVLPESSTLSKTSSSSKPLEISNLGPVQFSNGSTTSLNKVDAVEGGGGGGKGESSPVESVQGESTIIVDATTDSQGNGKKNYVGKKVDVSKKDDVSKKEYVSRLASALSKQTESDLKKKIMKKYSYPNRVTRCLKALKKYSKEPEVEEGLENCLQSFRGVLNGKDMVAVMKECSNEETALKFFRWCQQEEGLSADVIHYNVLISKLGKAGQLSAAERLVKEMLTAKLKPDNYTCSSIVSTATRCGSPSTALNWFQKMQDEGVIPDQITYCSVINTLGRSGNIKQAIKLFIQMRKKGWKLDVSTYNVVLHLFSQSSKWREAVDVLRDMKLHGLQPNSATYSILISAFAKANLTKQAHQFFLEMYEKDIEPSSLTVTAMIMCLGKQGDASSALEVFDLSKKKFGQHTALYNSILRICISHGLLVRAEEILDEMEKSGAVRDEFTFSIMIRFFAETGQVDKALELFKAKKSEGKDLHGADFAALVKGLGLSRNFGQVEKLFEELPEESLRWVSDSLSLGQLLKVLSLCQNAEEAGHILNCFKVVAPELYGILSSPVRNFQVGDKKLTTGSSGSPEKNPYLLQVEAFLRSVPASKRNLICNHLVNVLWDIGLKKRAVSVFYAGRATGAFKGLFTQNLEEMSLHLKHLIMGPCQVAIREWLKAMNAHFNTPERRRKKIIGNDQKEVSGSPIFLSWGFVAGQEVPELVRIHVGLQSWNEESQENEQKEEKKDKQDKEEYGDLGGKGEKGGNGDVLLLKDDMGTKTVDFNKDLKVEERKGLKTEQNNEELLSSQETKVGNEVKLRSFRATVIEELKALGAPFKEERGEGREGWLVGTREEVQIWLKDKKLGSYLKCKDSLLETFEGWPCEGEEKRGREEGSESEKEKGVLNKGVYQAVSAEVDV